MSDHNESCKIDEEIIWRRGHTASLVDWSGERERDIWEDFKLWLITFSPQNLSKLLFYPYILYILQRYPNKVPKFEERTSPSIFSFFPFDESVVQILQQRRRSIEEQQRSKTNISTSSVDSKVWFSKFCAAVLGVFCRASFSQFLLCFHEFPGEICIHLPLCPFFWCDNAIIKFGG